MFRLGENIGQFVTGSFTKLKLRQKSGEIFEIGQLFVSGEDLNDYSIFQVNELFYGSQIPDNALELMAGYQLERERAGLAIYEPELRNYVMARARPLIRVKFNEKSGKLEPFLPKTLPKFFGSVFKINDEHLKFMEETELDNPINLGNVRSGSRVLKTTVNLEAIEVLTHHVLIPATTGRGKSNLVKVILFNLMENINCGKLVFDPHNEYHESLQEHPENREYLRYYTPREHVAKIDLQFNLNAITPGHVMGAIDVSQPQREALILYHRQYRDQWITNLFSGSIPDGVDTRTINALQRKVGVLLNLEVTKNNGKVELNDRGIYKLDGHETTVNDILRSLEEGKTVVIDTSLFTGAEEIFIATIIVERLFNTYRRYKFNNQLQNFPVISIVLEEAPRVIGKSALNVSENVFETIAREGRKFNIGLIAITQLPSIIDREILANMNTKIILGNEMGPERNAIIESAAQDLSDDYQNIGSLDKGEAIITSNFTKFAVPIKIPFISDLIQDYKNKNDNKSKNIQRKSPF